jgi:hypothetical protein
VVHNVTGKLASHFQSTHWIKQPSRLVIWSATACRRFGTAKLDSSACALNAGATKRRQAVALQSFGKTETLV